MKLGEALQVYFRGERNFGIGMAVLGVVMMAAAFWIWRAQAAPFKWWLLTPFAVVGLGAAGGGVFFAVKTEAQLARLAAELERAPVDTVRAETARMTKVNANWPRLKLGWGVLTLGALVLLLAVKREWASGLGLALIALATTLFFVDVLAERRALPYTAALRAAAGK
ncbi:MAG: hypothetical protein IT370_27490 [Deltaproteobacteria bacterium]|nr:hypothetical protein [Deltaproteobacteria bacterium]